MSGNVMSIMHSDAARLREAAIGPAATPCPDAVGAATHLRLELGPEERTVAVTGLESADGASLLAREVAAALALIAQEPVVLVNAPSSAGGASDPGMAEVLDGALTLDQALVPAEFAGLSLLAAGQHRGSPLAAYSSPECGALLTALEARFRYVIVDAGPLRRPEALLLISRCQAVVAALAETRRRRSDALEVKKEIGRLKTRLLGVVLTRQR